MGLREGEHFACSPCKFSTNIGDMFVTHLTSTQHTSQVSFLQGCKTDPMRTIRIRIRPLENIVPDPEAKNAATTLVFQQG